MTKLTERDLVKELLGIARADTINDLLINRLIEVNSEEAERICRRKFAKATRTSYHQSYEQAFGDPTHQYVWLDGPVDLGQPFLITYASLSRHETDGRTLQPTEYRLEAETGLVTVMGGRLGTDQAIVQLNRGILYEADPAGFKVTYTGGYVTTAKPGVWTDDPLDDFDVTQVPSALKMIVASKVARDMGAKGFQTWSEDEKRALKPWTKKDVFE